ncbi:hypothetical protein LCGC14_1822230, partial [marine sediment metagenome]
IGLEPTPELYVEHIVQVMRDIRRVLRDDGTLWLNLGDSYATGSGGPQGEATITGGRRVLQEKRRASIASLKPKDLVGIPWMVAFALRTDGWYLRQDIIWHKPNPMPESVKDRCTKAHEYIFLLTKQPKYYCDMDAIKEPSIRPNEKQTFGGEKARSGQEQGGDPRNGHRANQNSQWGKDHTTGIARNKRSVWTVTTKPYSEAHFATFPPDLIEPCILAGCPEHVCKKCGKARTRITEGEQIKRRRKTPVTKPCNERSPSANAVAGVETKTTGWSDCGCGAGFQPGIVLDPFMGSGTTAMVAYENRRDYVGCEMNPDYIKLNRADKAKAKYGLFES